MLELILLGTCALFGILQIIVGIYWFYVIIRDHNSSNKSSDMDTIKTKTEMETMKSISTSANETTTTNVTDSPNMTSNETSKQNIESNVKNTSTLPFSAKLYTTIAILGYTLYSVWVILYFGIIFILSNNTYVSITDVRMICGYI